MQQENTISRKTFLVQSSALAAGVLLNPVTEFGNKPADKKIKVAVIGCGSVSNRYLPHLSECPYVELVSTCDIKPDRAIKQAEKFKVPNNYPHISKMLAGAEFDLMAQYLSRVLGDEHLRDVPRAIACRP